MIFLNSYHMIKKSSFHPLKQKLFRSYLIKSLIQTHFLEKKNLKVVSVHLSLVKY